MKPDLVWIRRDAGDDKRKVVVDVMVPSTDKMNDASREKDENIENGPPEKRERRRR